MRAEAPAIPAAGEHEMTAETTARTHRGSARAGRAALLPALALLLAASGCSWFGDDEAPASKASPAPVEQVSAAVEVIGADVEVGDAIPAPATGRGLEFVSDLHELSGARLVEPALVRVELDGALPDGTPVAVATRDGEEGAWRFAAGRLDADGTHAEFILSELGTVGVLALDADAISGRLADQVDAALEQDAASPDGVEAATCEDSAGATQDGYRAQSWNRRTLDWCLDLDGDARVLRVTNQRGVPVRVSAPGAAGRGTTGEPARRGVAWDAWTAAVASGLATGAGGTDAVLAPGQSLELDADLEPGSSLLLTASDETRNRAVQLLHATTDGLAEQVAGFGLAPRRDVPGARRVLTRLLEVPACAGALDGSLGTLVRRCLSTSALEQALGPQGALAAQALTPRRTTAMLRARLAPLRKAAAKVEQRVEITRDTPQFGPLVGRFTGTARSLVVTADGLATETFGTADGPVLTVGYQLGDPDVGGRSATATATVTSVQVLDRAAAKGLVVPRVGQSGVLSIAPAGVIASPFLGRTYCTDAARARCTDPAAPTPRKTTKGRTPAATSPTTAPPAPATGSGARDR